METKIESPTREAIDTPMAYGRVKLELAMLKPEQEMAISDFALGKFISYNGNNITSK